ncbi:hypothetical protein AVEN_13039-1 [Araneus ventricosus]|uniref:Uncharacterized protein n=1 Tax=Araneus ventricosus TaxID=182803 RepID=A0A4Y2IM24_ARAVE|nr:hypothetical protein AVEN_13039-1 [Araneus ventricosus]
MDNVPAHADVETLKAGTSLVYSCHHFAADGPGSCGNCEEDDVSSWLDCDADDEGFQLMSDDEIIYRERKPNSDDDKSESDEGEVIETSKISNSDAFKCIDKGLMWLAQQTDSNSAELMLLKQLRDRAAKRRLQSKLPFKPM